MSLSPGPSIQAATQNLSGGNRVAGKAALSTPWLVDGDSPENLQQLREDTIHLAGQPVGPGIQVTSEL